MDSSRTLVLTRTAITVISIFVALPLAAWPLMYLPPDNALIEAVNWCYENIIVEQAAWIPLALFMMLAIESTFRSKCLTGLRRLPWFSIVYLPAIAVCLLALLITEMMLISNITPYTGIWSIGVLLFFQFVGHVSLVESVRDDSHFVMTDPHH